MASELYYPKDQRHTSCLQLVLLALVLGTAAFLAFRFLADADGGPITGAEALQPSEIGNPDDSNSEIEGVDRLLKSWNQIPVPLANADPSGSAVFGAPSEPETQTDPTQTPEAVEPPSNQTVQPTYAWVNAFGTQSMLDDEPIPKGAVVTAYDPDRVLVGRTIVRQAGQYGALALYMDDPETTEDEGAEPGDTVSFRVNNIPATVLGPSEPVWTGNGAVLLIELSATTVS